LHGRPHVLKHYAEVSGLLLQQCQIMFPHCWPLPGRLALYQLNRRDVEDHLQSNQRLCGAI